MNLKIVPIFIFGFFIMPISLSLVDTSQPWHPASKIAKSTTDLGSIDEDEDGTIDYSETLKLNAGKAKIGDGSSITVLEIAGHPNSFSAIDLFSGDQNLWGIGRNNLGNFYIDKGGVGNAFTIDSDREVGIGTINPQNKLDVVGNIKATGDICTDVNGGKCLGTLNLDETDPQVGSVLNQKWCVGDGNSVQCTQDAPISDDGDWIVAAGDIYRETGNVGIGTSSPNSKLEVDGLIHTTSGGVKFPDGSVQATSFIPHFNSGDLLWHSNDQGYSVGEVTSPTLAKSTQIAATGTLRIRYTAGVGSVHDFAVNIYSYIAKNGQKVGTQHSHTYYFYSYGTGLSATYTEDISGWEVGDKIEVYCWSDYSDIGYDADASCTILDLRLYVDKSPSQTVILQ
jgi:hypothetical protein